MIVIVIVFFGVVMGMVFIKLIKPTATDALVAAIMFLPAILYLVQSYDLAEFSVFGTTGKFERRLEKKISSVISNEKPGVDELAIYSVSANKSDFDKISTFEICENYLVMRPEKVPKNAEEKDDYVNKVTLAIKASLTCGKLVGVVVLDKDNGYIGSYEAGFFGEALALWAVPNPGEIPAPKKLVAESISGLTSFGAAILHPKERITPGEGFVAAINKDSQVGDAFLKFQNEKVSFLVITDELGKFTGVLPYKSVVDYILNDQLNGLAGQ